MQFPIWNTNFEGGPDLPSNWTKTDTKEKLFIKHYTQLAARGREKPIAPRVGAWCLMADFEASSGDEDAYIEFDDPDNNIEIGKSQDWEEWYISFWHFMDSAVWAKNDTLMTLLQLYYDADPEAMIQLKYVAEGDYVGWYIGLADEDKQSAPNDSEDIGFLEGQDPDGTDKLVDTTRTYKTDQWNHICMYVKYKNGQSNCEAQLFLNGELCGEKYVSWSAPNDELNKIRLGASNLTGVFLRGFMLFDDFRLWQEATDRPRPESVDKLEKMRYSLHSDGTQAEFAEHVFLGPGEIERIMLSGHTTGSDGARLDLYDTDRSQAHIERHVARIHTLPNETHLLKGREFGPLKFNDGCYAVITKASADDEISAWFEISDKLGDEKVTYREAVAEHGRMKAKLFDPELDLD